MICGPSAINTRSNNDVIKRWSIHLPNSPITEYMGWAILKQENYVARKYISYQEKSEKLKYELVL